MKKTHRARKLVLNTQTVRSLDAADIRSARGAAKADSVWDGGCPMNTLDKRCSVLGCWPASVVGDNCPATGGY